MKKRVKQLGSLIMLIRTIIPVLAVVFDKKLRKYVYKDLYVNEYRCIFKKTDSILFLNYLLQIDLSFRAIFYFRLRKNHIISYYISNILLPNKKDIDIYGDIQPGFRIFHGHGSVIVCNKAGENFSVWQNVTIGRNPKTAVNSIDTPSFGNNVNVYANSVVIGNITIGDNVNIAAGAVVYKSVPDNCTVVGNQMKIIKKKISE